jgi:hypothetical protein
MIYIHTLKDLHPKTAEIESTLLIRELKKNHILPLPESSLQEHFFTFFMSETDKQSILSAISLIEPVSEEIKAVLAEKNPIHEPINLQRAINIVGGLPAILTNTLNYADEISNWKSEFTHDFAILLNMIPELKTKEQKVALDKNLSQIFEKILRNNQFAFNLNGVINEAHVEHISSLCASMSNGYFFHVTLEEEIKKQNFDNIKERIPFVELERVTNITQKLLEIKKGVERAYENNMRMVNLAVLLYSYIKWANQKLK